MERSSLLLELREWWPVRCGGWHMLGHQQAGRGARTRVRCYVAKDVHRRPELAGRPSIIEAQYLPGS